MDSFDYFLAKANSSGGDEAVLEPLTATENGTYTPESGVDGFDEVTVAVPIPPAPTGTISITENGTVDVSEYATANVNVPQGYPDNYCKINKYYTAGLGQGTIFDTALPKEFTLDFSDVVITNLWRIFRSAAYDNNLEKVVLIGDMSKVANYMEMFSKKQVLKEIVGNIDFSACDTTGRANLLYYADNVEKINFVPNTLKVSINLPCNKFTDDSLISLANCLSSEAEAQTVSVSGSSSTEGSARWRMDRIMGNVVDGLFAADVAGTTTLADFVTETKGWDLSA